MEVPGLLIVLIAVFCGLLFVGVILLASALSGMRKQVESLQGKLDKIDGRLQQQEKEIAGLRAELDDRPSDLMKGVVSAIKDFKAKGLVPALTVLGTTLFKAYLKKRKQRALPPAEDTETQDESI